jgi:hypothetical protein
MNIIKEKRIINLNSEDATNYYNGSFLSDVNFNFRGLLKDEDNVLYCEGGILNAQIPVSFYQVAYYNNTLVYQVQSLGIQTLTIPVGNYNFATFSTALQDAFTAQGYNIIVTISETTGNLTFQITGFSNFTFYGASSGTTIFKILGFDPTQDYLSTGTSLSAPYLLNLLGPKKLKIISQAFSNSSNDTTNYATSNLIATLSVDAPSYGLIIFNNLVDSYGRLRVKQIDNVDIQIKDEYGNLINFNNTDWSITLAINIFRKIEFRDNDLGKIFDTLNIIKEELAPPTEENIEGSNVPPYPPNLEDFPTANGIANIPTQENIAPENLGEIPETTDILEPNLNDLTDLDLLLYENPNLF